MENLNELRNGIGQVKEIINEDSSKDLSIDMHKQLFNEADEATFVMEVDEEIVPRRFIDFNSKACSLLGYTDKELASKLPLNILVLKNVEEGLEVCKNLKSNKCTKTVMVLRRKNFTYALVEANIYLLSLNKKNIALMFAKDITESKTIEKGISGIINGIADVIKVYKTDQTILFFNEAGYKFYNTTLEEVKGKRCSDILPSKKHCIDCPFKVVMSTKKMVEVERYFPEFNTYMDICCNPVFNEDGDIVFVVERLRDITDKKMLNNILKENNEKYEQIVNSFPNAVIITEDNKFVLANDKACELFGIKYEKLIGTSIYKYIPTKHTKAVHKRSRQILQDKIKNVSYDYRLECASREPMDIQISSSYILFQGKSAILSVITDVSWMKKELNRASNFQKEMLQKSFPLPEKIKVSAVFIPAKNISGDFYRVYKVNDNLIIGILLDVSGKGIKSALSISALDVLFMQEVSINNNHSPGQIIKNINKNSTSLLGDNYIAACCFGINFNTKELKVVGAGISEFYIQRKGMHIEEQVVRGAFIGMFEDSIFEEKVIPISQGDKLFFFSDGLEFVFNEDSAIKRYMEEVNIYEFEKIISKILSDKLLEVGSLKDDCTVISMEVL